MNEKDVMTAIIAIVFITIMDETETAVSITALICVAVMFCAIVIATGGG